MSQLPTIKPAELVKFLRAQGWVEDLRSVSHVVYRHPERKGSITVPVRTGCNLGRGLTSSILKEAGIFTDYFIRKR